MKPKKYQTSIVLLCTILAANLAVAKQGADDVGSDDNTRKSSNTITILKPTQTNHDMQLKGELHYSEKPHRKLKELDVRVKTGFGAGRTFANLEEVRNATLIININGLECTLDFDQQTAGKRVEFKLRIREKNGNLEIRDGDCVSEMMPIPGAVTVEYDQDDDPATPNFILLQSN